MQPSCSTQQQHQRSSRGVRTAAALHVIVLRTQAGRTQLQLQVHQQETCPAASTHASEATT